MIWESRYWKDPLLQSATWLRRVRFGEGTRETTFVKIEKEIFVGFYAIRKLFDTAKVSDVTKTMKFAIRWHAVKKQIDNFNWHKIDEVCELETSVYEERDIRYLCNLVVHSYVFILCGDERIEGIYVSSDRTKKTKIYFVSLDQVLSIFRLVGRDYPSEATFIRHPKTGEFEFSAK